MGWERGYESGQPPQRGQTQWGPPTHPLRPCATTAGSLFHFCSLHFRSHFHLSHTTTADTHSRPLHLQARSYPPTHLCRYLLIHLYVMVVIARRRATSFVLTSILTLRHALEPDSTEGRATVFSWADGCGPR